MAKRSRGPARPAHRRPGTRPPTTRSAKPGRPIRAASQLEVAEEIAEEIVEEHPAAIVERDPERIARTSARQRIKAGSVLAAKAATEYVYVAQDLRRIVILSAIMFAVLAVLWVVFVLLRLIPLDFY